VLVWYNEDTVRFTSLYFSFVRSFVCFFSKSDVQKGNPQFQVIEGSLSLVGASVVLPKEKGCDFALLTDAGPTIFFKAATVRGWGFVYVCFLFCFVCLFGFIYIIYISISHPS
jgi:hypothetical protein